MPRCLCAILLFGVTALLALQAEPPAAVGQEKKEKAKAKKKKDEPPPSEIREDTSRVLPVFDHGAHTQPISAMGFTKDNSKLVTVGQDFTIQVWSAATGERLDILRLPGYGREKGYDPGRWDFAAVSADGAFVAIGGQPKFLYDTEAKATAPCRLLLVDVANRKVMKLDLPGNSYPVVALAFAPDGDRLAIGLNRIGQPKLGTDATLYVVGNLKNRLAQAKPPFIRTGDCSYIRTPHTEILQALAFSPDGKKLAVGGRDARVTIWDVPAGAAPKPTLEKEVAVEGETASLDWAPDSKSFARAASGGNQSAVNGIELWNADGTSEKKWKLADMRDVLQKYGHIDFVRFNGPSQIFFVGDGFVEKGEGSGIYSATLDMNTGAARRLTAHTEGMRLNPVGAVSPDSQQVASSITGGTEVVVGAPAQGAKRFICGGRTPLPSHVGWSKDPAAPGFAWTEERHTGREPLPAGSLRFGFDLAKMEPLGAIRSADYDSARWKHGEWSIELQRGKADAEGKNGAIKQGDKVVGTATITGPRGKTLIPQGDAPPLIATATFGHIALFKADGTRANRFLPDNMFTHDLATSPDGKFLIATTGTPRIVVYRTDAPPYPLFSFAQLNGEWVLWTPEGYYAASPGGEKLFGWAISGGPNELVKFHPAEKYAQQFRRPDIIKLAIEKGSVAAALKSLDAEKEDLDDIAPPKAELKLIKQEGASVSVRASASTGAKDKPILAMRVLLDGRPLPEGKGVLTVAMGKPAEAEWQFDIPGGSHELKLLARSDDGSAISDPLVVVGPKVVGQQPVLHRICIGINDYDDPGLKLNAAAKDAQEVFDALEAHCVGSSNRFGAAGGEKLLNKEATRDAVLKSLKSLRKAAKPGHLAVIFFAGHGVKQANEFYLLTKEADLSKESLEGTALSGADLRKALSDVECPVLLILDACHSAKAVKIFRPATDELTRNLTDDSAGITVMAAAMAHEVAGATAENGHFTAALLKALKVEAGVPFDPYERQLYTHHVYSVVFSEVRKATGGKQNPFLNSPWTVPPLALREVPKQ